MLANPQKSNVHEELDRLGFSYYEEANFPLTDLSKDRRVQVRDPEHYAPKANVDTYANQMREKPFPAIVVTKNKFIVDGNTRVGATEKNKNKFIHAIIIDYDYGSNPKKDQQLLVLAATLNQFGGQRLSTLEARKASRTMIALGWKPEQIGRALGLQSTHIANVKREMSAEEKFSRVKFTHMKKLSQTAVRALGSSDVVVINDLPFKALAELTLDAGLNATEIKEEATAIKTAGSDTLAMEHLGKRRAFMDERIREHALTGNGKPAPSSQLRRFLGFVINNTKTPELLVERSPDAMNEHLQIVADSIVVLTAVLGAQKDLIDE